MAMPMEYRSLVLYPHMMVEMLTSPQILRFFVVARSVDSSTGRPRNNAEFHLDRRVPIDVAPTLDGDRAFVPSVVCWRWTVDLRSKRTVELCRYFLVLIEEARC